MNILLVNGNMTQAVTDTCVADARKHCAATTTIAGATARYGASIVTAEPENLIASMAVLDMLAEHYNDYDAAILAISFDSGLFAARDLVPIPVIGMTEAALLAAAAHSSRIGVLIFGTASLPLYCAMINRYPMRDKVAEIRVVEVASVSPYLDAFAMDEAVFAAIEDLRRREGIETIVICGAAMCGMAERLQPTTPSKLFGGMASAISQTEAIVGLGRPQIKPRSALASSACISGVSPHLLALFAVRNAR